MTTPRTSELSKSRPSQTVVRISSDRYWAKTLAAWRREVAEAVTGLKRVMSMRYAMRPDRLQSSPYRAKSRS